MRLRPCPPAAGRPPYASSPTAVSRQRPPTTRSLHASSVSRVAEDAQLQREAELVAGTPPDPDVLQILVAQGVVAQQVRLPDAEVPGRLLFDAQRDLDRDTILQVFGCGFVAEAVNVGLVSGVGTGKTQASIALGQLPVRLPGDLRDGRRLVTLLVEGAAAGPTRPQARATRSRPAPGAADGHADRERTAGVVGPDHCGHVATERQPSGGRGIPEFYWTAGSPAHGIRSRGARILSRRARGTLPAGRRLRRGGGFEENLQA